MLYKKLLLLFSLLYQFQISAQKILINGDETSRLLKWEDFTGKPDKDSKYFAYTYCDITYHFDAFQFKKDTVKWQVFITMELSKNSWRKKDKVTDTLLQHEQGHFYIGTLCAREMQQKINTTVFFKSDYVSKLNAVIKDVNDKYKKLEQQYDEATHHHANREEQWKWDAFFISELSKSR